MSVYSKLMKCRLDLQSRKLAKTGHNKFADYYYFELGDFLPTIQEIFADNGLCGIVSYGVEIATLTILDEESSGSVVITSPMSSAALKGCHAVQNLGAVQTYIRRYLWVTAMEIVEHDALETSLPISENGPDVNVSISAIFGTNNMKDLTALFAVEVKKFDPKSKEYKALKSAATAQRKHLEAPVGAPA